MGAVFASAVATSDIAKAAPEAIAGGMQVTFAVAGVLTAVALALAVGSRALGKRALRGGKASG